MSDLSRADYVRHCKRAALATLEKGEVREAVIEFLTLLEQRTDTKQDPLFALVSGMSITNETDARRFIEGFDE